MKVIKLVKNTIVDGPGIRTSLYLSGCSHMCRNCHNPSSWDVDCGTEMPTEQVVTDILSCDTKGLTITGGDPLFQVNAVIELCKMIKKIKPEMDVWLYTGYLFEDIYLSDIHKEVLQYIEDRKSVV